MSRRDTACSGPEEAGQLRDVGGWALAVFLEFRYVADHNIAKTPTPTAVNRYSFVLN